MAQIFVIMNQKGGAGKTTTSMSLAAGLAYCGKKVLGIDFDAQGQLTKLAGAKCDNNATVGHFLVGEKTFSDTVCKVSFGDLLPSNNQINSFLRELSIKPSAPLLLKKILKPLASSYDFIIIDCPAAVNAFTVSAIIAADKLIIPTQADYLGVDGVSLMSSTLKEIKEAFDVNFEIAGLLLVQYTENFNETKFHQNILETIASEYLGTKVFNAKIRNTVAVKTSQRLHKSIFEFNPKCTASLDYLALIKELLTDANVA